MANVLAYSLTLFFLAALMAKVQPDNNAQSTSPLYGQLLSAVLVSGPVSLAFQVIAENYEMVLQGLNVIFTLFLFCGIKCCGKKKDASTDADADGDGGKVAKDKSGKLAPIGFLYKLTQPKLNAKGAAQVKRSSSLDRVPGTPMDGPIDQDVEENKE